MRKRWLFPTLLSIVTMTSMAATTQAQFHFSRGRTDFALGPRLDPAISTGYYGGGDYRRYYSYGRDYWPRWYGIFYYGPRQPIISPPAGPLVGAPPGIAEPPVINLQPAPASFEVQLPAEAILWIEGKRMTQTGESRRFVSPPLEPGQRYTYDLRAHWKEGDREITQSQTVDVTAGGQRLVRFPTPTARGPSRIEEIGRAGDKPGAPITGPGKITEFPPDKK
jgi:uncharacterized protein (TIGR03000 family)